MKRHYFTCFSYFTLFLIFNCNVIECNSCNVWPKPTFCESDHFLNTIDPKLFQVQYNQSWYDCDLMLDLVDRYTSIFFSEDCSILHSSKSSASFDNYNYNLGLLVRVPLILYLEIVTQSNECPSVVPEDADESYSISIKKGKAILSANQIWGVIRGMETFAQLITIPETIHPSWKSSLFLLNDTKIVDQPRFLFRGFLVDTSRHYLPIVYLRQMLDAMAYNKMNVFHWHIVDDQSFPYQSEQFPNMSQIGAFTANHVYTIEDVIHVTQYARLRGIRVVPEFDTPGHTLSWRYGSDQLLTPCYADGKLNGEFGPIDPTVESNYEFLRRFFEEISQVFPDSYIHLGGDEVPFDCWQSNSAITTFMAKNSIKTFEQLEAYYFKRLAAIVSKLKKQYIVWQEVFDNVDDLDPSTIVNVWKGSKDEYLPELENLTKKGFKAILSSPWYLNYISYGIDWHPYYQVEPRNITGNDAQKELIIGGSACMWGEHIDATNLISTSWARGSAVAERLWSSKDTTDIKDATIRIEKQRCRMVNRGLRVKPINGPGFCKCDYLL